MRELFISEDRYIRNILRKVTDVRVESFGPVTHEIYAPRRTSRVRFNNDFTLYFAPQEEWPTYKATGTHILPNTLGVDVFLAVAEKTGRPLMTELLGGEGFPRKYFNEYIETIEDRLTDLKRPLKIKRSSYVRLFVIDNDICFLAFTSALTPAIAKRKERLCIGADSSITCGMDGSNLVYVDGWIRTTVPETELKREAILKRRHSRAP